ncbi:hypothetical protein [Okeania sp. SIO1I7]|nr:hypothetical protein [Okeania sp. SIO1I7]
MPSKPYYSLRFQLLEQQREKKFREKLDKEKEKRHNGTWLENKGL